MGKRGKKGGGTRKNRKTVRGIGNGRKTERRNVEG